MPSFDIVRKTEPEKTFRVASVIGRFDLQSQMIEERFTGNIDLPEDWQIGLIVGKSGSGKTTIAKELFPKAYIINFNYKAKSILDDMPKDATVEEITKTFNAVGFSSPPSWLKPYSVLSNGEKMRVDLARAILSNQDLFVFDEFTSVVDRQVAKIGSFAMQKAIRKAKSDSKGKKRFIAVTCHSDVEDWLLPDWVFDTDTMSFRLSQKKNRPSLKFEVFKTSDKNHYWRMFGKHHYLSHSHHKGATVYIAAINGEPCGFCSTLQLPHPHAKKIRKIHRLVVSPDYQGLWVGGRLLNVVAAIEKANGYRISIVTSAPALVQSLAKDGEWKCTFHGRMQTRSRGSTVTDMRVSRNRITTSFEYIPKSGKSAVN